MGGPRMNSQYRILMPECGKIHDLELPRPQSPYALFDALVQLYMDAKREALKSGPEPANLFFQTHFGNPQGKTLLDIGCGTGDEAANYERAGFEVVSGIDPSRSMLDHAFSKVAHPQNFHQAGFERTGFQDQSFDAVVGSYSFHYVDDLDQAYQELWRILRPRGLLLLSVPHPFSDLQEPRQFWKDGRKYVNGKVYERLSVEHPMHMIQEYFSRTFLLLFDLIEVQEWGKHELAEQGESPRLFGYAARKR